ncbi:MAG: cadmium resistance transporter [Cyanobacteriota bacterium]|nr:cadmium resistance transporter [Cyanobacteriota bacterium]
MNKLFLAMAEGTSAFAATNIDDLMILLLFFAQTNAAFRSCHVVIGSYWGFAVLVTFSLVGFWGGLVVSSAWLGLLGLLPIILGIKKLIQPEPENTQPQEIINDISSRSNSPPLIAGALQWLHPQTYQVATVTVANGGDNIGVYIPLFAASDAATLGVLLIVFFLLKGAWCYAAYRLIQNPNIACVLTRYGHSVVPFLLIGLGLLILWKNGTLKVLIRS